MTGILAIDTATDACSVALQLGDRVQQCHEIAPRQHSQRLFGMLRELLPGGDLRAAGVEAIAYGCGPGSFTGLRIAASAVQGLAFAADVPAIAVSTLACQAQTALRESLVDEGGLVLSMIDARINEIYAGLFRFADGLAQPVGEAMACPPEALVLPEGEEAVHLVGDGAAFASQLSPVLRGRITAIHSELTPQARDLVPLARNLLAHGQQQAARDVQPVYVRDEISWKKLSEQGKRS